MINYKQIYIYTHTQIAIEAVQSKASSLLLDFAVGTQWLLLKSFSMEDTVCAKGF